MDNYKQKNDEAPLHIYKPSGWMQAGLAVAIVFVVIHFSVMMQVGMDMGIFFLFFIVFYGFMLWLLIIMSTQQHLAIYENGLEYRLGTNRVFSRWEDLQCIARRGSGKSLRFGIVCRSIEIRQEGSSLEKMIISEDYKVDFISLNLIFVPWDDSVVDIAAFAETEFGQELYHFAPHLFEYEKEKVKNG